MTCVLSVSKLRNIAVCIFLSSASFAAEVSFTVNNVRGDCFYRSPNATSWTRLEKGQELGSEYLVQTHQSGSVDIKTRYTHSKGAFDSNSVNFTIGSAMIVRLAPDLFRDVKLQKAFLDNAPQLLTGDEEKPPIPPQGFYAAWNKLSLFMSNPKALAMLSLSKKQGDSLQDVKLNVENSGIKLLLPGQKYVVRTRDPQAELRLFWEDKLKKDKYYIYLWEEGSDRGEPINKTDETFHTITIPHQGNFFVQISSKDGKRESEPTGVSVAPPDMNMNTTDIKLPKGKKQLEGKKNFLIRLVVPSGRSAELLTSTQSRNAVFKWKTRGDFGVKFYQIKIIDNKGVVIKNVQTPNTQYATNLPVGRYSWSVEAKDGENILKSDKYNISVIQVANAAVETHIVQALLKNADGGSVWLGE